jgi:hypothetical protein
MAGVEQGREVRFHLHAMNGGSQRICTNLARLIEDRLFMDRFVYTIRRALVTSRSSMVCLVMINDVRIPSMLGD